MLHVQIGSRTFVAVGVFNVTFNICSPPGGGGGGGKAPRICSRDDSSLTTLSTLQEGVAVQMFQR